MNRFVTFLCAALCAFGPAVTAGASVPFDGRWKEQRFSLFASNEYLQRGASLDVASDATVSLLWRAVPEHERGAKAASWSWKVDTSVPATDLSQKGGDDRNLSLYFIFLPSAKVAEAENRSIRWLLKQPDIRALLYVWGGPDGQRGRILASPYLPGQGVTIPLRAAGSGQFSERVDLRGDYQRAFGGEPGALIGVAVSADSDDTQSHIRATLSDLTLTD